MADGRPTPHGASASSRPRRGLGNGLGSLIPDAPPAARTEGARPLDVLFPESASAKSPRTRGGSARDLLQPRRSSQGRKKVSRETSDLAADRRQDQSETTRAWDDGVSVESRIPTTDEDPAMQINAEVRYSDTEILDSLPQAQDGAGARAVQRSAQIIDEMNEGVTGTRQVATDDVSRETSGGEDGVQEGVSSREFVRESGASSAHTRRGDRHVSRATTSVLDAIMGTTQHVSRETSEDEPELMAVPGASFGILRIDEIIPNSRQPREVFDEDELAELAASIAEVGILQPIVVRPITPTDEPTEALRILLEAKPEARYELIMGERRLRASELAGNSTIPAIIRDTDDDDLLRDALLENLHRVQLNPLEEASAYQQLMADFGATQEELAKRIARSRPQIANTLRLLKLPPAVQRKLAGGSITAGHARALLGLNESADMERLAERIVAEGLSVRTTEELVRLGLPRHPVATKLRRDKTLSPLGERLVSTLSDTYDTRVTISEGRRKGKIVIEFAGPDDLERIAALLVKQ